MKRVSLKLTIAFAMTAVMTAATGCTAAWWDTTISPYDYYDDPMAPPPPGLYPLPSRPIFYPNGYGPGWGPAAPGWNRPLPPVYQPVPPQNNRPPQNNNQPPQNTQKPDNNGQRPGGNVRPGNTTITNPGSSSTTTGNSTSGSHTTGNRRGGNVKPNN